MSLREIEVFLPQNNVHQVETLLQDHSVIGMWHSPLSTDQSLVKILVSSEEAESAIDCLQERFSETEGFRILLLEVEASIPRPELPEDKSNESNELDSQVDLDPERSRINRHELYDDVSKTVVITSNHLAMVFLATLIASIGLLRNEETIIIGAMVIAPLLGPNMALSLATTLGDFSLAQKAIKIGSLGMAIALGFSIGVGFFVPVSPDIPEIASRITIRWSDVILAFASGMAGALSFTSGTIGGIVGVMVAVALLPPLVTFGMLLGSGQWEPAVGSMLLLLTNLICLNLAGVLTFSAQNIRPGQWWKAHRAEKATNTAYFLWIGLLSIVAAGIWWWRNTHTIL